MALRNWTAFNELGIASVYAPGCYFSMLSLNAVVDIGDYESPRSPDEPMLVRMVRTPCLPGLPERDQNRAGQPKCFNTPFETFERNIRDQLARTPRSWRVRPGERYHGASPSIAGRTATLTNTIRCSIRNGRRRNSRM